MFKVGVRKRGVSGRAAGAVETTGGGAAGGTIAKADMAKKEQAGEETSRGSRLVREWLVPLLAVAAVVAPLRSVVADWNDVPSGSMRPTILEGDRITVNKLAFGLRVPFSGVWVARWGEPARGDIVTFASPVDGTRLVKRVVGLPGDRIAMRAGRLFVNGEPVGYEVTESHGDGRLPTGQAVETIVASERLGERAHAVVFTPEVPAVRDMPETSVPAGCFYMMGDNRDLSNDSRFYGAVPVRNVYGRVGYVALSVNPGEGYVPRWERWFSALR